MDELKLAISTTKDLFTRNRHSESWSDNIINGSKYITDPNVWTHYYDFLVNPKDYKIPTKLENIEYHCNETQIPPYPADMIVKEYKNGSDITVIVTKKDNKNEDDEKSNEDEKCIS